MVTDPTDAVVSNELPAIAEGGVGSFKVFLTYDLLHVDDGQFISVLEAAKRTGAIVCVHCENYEAIR
ncbi:MAG: hypothetical protein QNJ43_07225 [Breoghania sp.]|nr:hypothetical protein [Breoghania sp.]